MQSIDTKLQLIKQIRERYYENMNDISARENIVYGQYKDTYTEDDKAAHSHFGLRLLLSCILFAAIVFMDIKEIKLAGITSDVIYKVISTNYEINNKFK